MPWIGETLTAGASGISDADGMTGATFSYQWVSNDGNGDTTIAAAMLDRLLHRCAVINIAGDSYRLRAHQARNQHQTTTIQPTQGELLCHRGGGVGVLEVCLEVCPDAV